MESQYDPASMNHELVLMVLTPNNMDYAGHGEGLHHENDTMVSVGAKCMSLL
jgi:hypothetical protein